jgi:hypothetical protein
MNVLAAGDLSEPITNAVTTLGPQATVVAGAAIGVGVILYGTRRLWGFFKGLAK